MNDRDKPMRELIAKWRALAIDLYYKKDEPIASYIVDDCADELEAALAATAQPVEKEGKS